MIKPETLLCPSPAGLYCPPGDFYVDPTRPVARAVITHGHSDHARSGHGAVLATAETLAIMEARYGAEFAGQTQILAYGTPIQHKDVEIMLQPGGAHPRLGASGGSLEGLQDRRLRRLQAQARSHLCALRAGAV